MDKNPGKIHKTLISTKTKTITYSASYNYITKRNTNKPYNWLELIGLISLDLMLAFEACHTFTNASVSIECHWSACKGSHHAENHHWTQ